MKQKMIESKISGRLILLTLAIKNSNKWFDIYNDIKSKTHLSEDQILKSIDIVVGDFMTIIDPDYPQILKDRPCPPFVILFNEEDQARIGDTSSQNVIKLLQKEGI